MKGSPIEEILREDPCSFQFFQAVTLLQRIYGDRRPVGRFSNPKDEVVHFRANNALGFPASQIQEIEWPQDEPAQMAINFMGLTGPSGVLPYCYTELILDRLKEKDGSLQSFLDIFNHRLVSFFYRAWEKYRFPVTYYLRGEDLFTHHLLDLIGLGTPGLQGRQAIPDEALLHYVGILGMHARSASALEHILSDYFAVPVEVEQFRGAWYSLDVVTRCELNDEDTESQKLGFGAVVGDEIWDQQSRVRVKLGPLTLSQYRDFLPNGSAFEPLRSFTKFFSNGEFDFDVQLILRRDDVPACEIGSGDATAPRLGWVTWLKSAPVVADKNETILEL